MRFVARLLLILAAAATGVVAARAMPRPAAAIDPSSPVQSNRERA